MVQIFGFGLCISTAILLLEIGCDLYTKTLKECWVSNREAFSFGRDKR